MAYHSILICDHRDDGGLAYLYVNGLEVAHGKGDLEPIDDVSEPGSLAVKRCEPTGMEVHVLIQCTKFLLRANTKAAL